jgi:SP family galactose:H+ symporter-like MFS transporter
MSARPLAAPASGRPPNADTSRVTPTVGGMGMSPWLYVVLVVVLCAGGLFGYDQGVISGALAGIKSTFSLSVLLVQVVTSWVTLGALMGSLAGGELADRFGRKRTLLIAGFLFTLGALVQAFASGTVILVTGRLIVGLGVGVAAVAAPLYAAELAPARLRGRFISSYQLAITIGIFLAYLVDGAFANKDSWRWMLGLSAVPGVLLLIMALMTRQSPRWLMMKERRDEASAEFLKINPGADAPAARDAVAVALKQEGKAASWGDVFNRQWRRPLMIGIGLAVFQQITGINAIIYYADQIFASVGFTTQASQTMVTTWAIGGVNVLSTFIAIAFIDKIGRRLLLLVGLIGMGASLAVVGAAFHYIQAVAPAVAGAAASTAGPTVAGIVTMVGLVCFIISFAFSMGPVVWTVINEIFPAKIRGRAVALATAVNWAAAFLVSEFFLSLIDAIGNSMTFWMFAFFCGVSWVWVYFRVPETKGQSLEQIQALWTSAKP